MHALREYARRVFRGPNSSPAAVSKKHDAELAFWRDSMRSLEDWFLKGQTGRSGIRPPRPEQKVNISESWVVNAVATRHAMCPNYTERLQIEPDHFIGKRVLEVGTGPFAPIQQFTSCTRHGIDPLANLYMAAGWPLYEYDVKIIHSGGECLPYRDGYFDSVISVNALDHVDDFERVASEMQRVLRPGGGIYFEVEYHTPTVTEPLELNDARVRRAFSQSTLRAVLSRSGRELYEAMLKRFDLLPYDFQHFDTRFCTWHGMRI